MSFWNKQVHSKSKDWKGNKRPKKYQIVGIIPKSNRTIVERGKNRYPKIHDRLLSWLGTGTSIKSGGLKFLKSWDIKTKSLNRMAKIRKDHLCLREENLSMKFTVL